MKLVQLLAKELKEWPVKEGEYNKESDYCAQSDTTSQVFFCGRHAETFLSERADETSEVRVTRSEWQAEREKMNKPKWIRHRGGKCPVKAGTRVSTKYRDGDVTGVHHHTAQKDSSIASLNGIWKHNGDSFDIMSYRVIEETKDQEIEEVKKTNFGTITYKLEIDATEATQRIDSLVAKWGQIESPLKWRDEIIELEAYEEEFRREREKLIRKLESEGFNLIDHAPAKCLLDEWEAMDYESFCVGDTVVCIHEKPDDTVAELTIGKEYRLILDDEQICVIDDIGDAMRYCIEIGCFKLVKRA